MRSIYQVVTESLETDTIVREALRLDIVNHSALARRLIETHGWTAAEEAVITAIRRFRAKMGESEQGRAKEVLSMGRLHMRSRIAIVKVSKSKEAQRLIPRLFDLVDYMKGETLRITQSDRSLKVFVDETKLEAVLQVLSAQRVEHVGRGLTEIRFVGPPECAGTPGVVALCLAAIAQRGVSLVEILSDMPEVLIFIEEESASQAYEALAMQIAALRSTSTTTKIAQPSPSPS
jgi:aspartokinase